jgi:hypothetical protein
MGLLFRQYFEGGGGGIERLIKKDILHLFDVSNSYYCIDCIKGKYVKKAKK